MARILLEHAVEDDAKWRAVYNADRARRDNIGLRQIGVYREADRPNEMRVAFDWDGSAAEAKIRFAKTMADPELTAHPSIIFSNSVAGVEWRAAQKLIDTGALPNDADWRTLRAM